MEPKIVDRAERPPAQCLFSADQDGPWIDTGVGIPWKGPYGYIGVAYFLELARTLFGLVSQEEVDAQKEPILARLAELEAEIEQLRAFDDADKKAKALLQGAGI